jgi:hypothetical protein
MSLSFNSEIFTGSITNYCISGSVSGPFTGSINGFTGSLTNFNGIISGYISGSYALSSSQFVVEKRRVLQRSLLKFDLTEISKSVTTAEIANPKFILNLKTTDASALPLTYKIYCYPLKWPWEMGNGIYAFGGSEAGVNWVFTNWPDTSSVWYPNIDTSYVPDENYLDYPSTASFMMGGGQWYYIVPPNFIFPSSSVQTTFFDTPASTFESVYSSSLQTNLTSSFYSILSSSLNSVLTNAQLTNANIQNSYTFLLNLTDSIYNNVTSSVNATTDPSSSLEVSASVCFLLALSSSLQSSLYPVQFSSSFASASYSYILTISSSLSSSIYSELYAKLNQLGATNLSNSLVALTAYNFYTNYYNSLFQELSTSSNHCFVLTSSLSQCDPKYAGAYAEYLNTSSLLAGLKTEYLGFVLADISPYILSSSTAVLQTQFSSSIFNAFSSSFMSYFNAGIQSVENYTYNQTTGSTPSYYVSSYFSSLQSSSSLICSQSFDYYQKSDIKMDITNICKAWMAGAVQNAGLILISSEEIANGDTNGKLKFFSKETNTIYTPYIDVQWDDSSFSTGELAPITSSAGIAVSIKNLKKEYKFGSMVRFDIFSRDLYPKKSFSRLQTVYLDTKYLPTSSYYAIKDMESDENVVDFDNYSKLSCDENGNYFKLDTTGLPQERYYKVLIKVVTDNFTEIYDSNAIFKIVR